MDILTAELKALRETVEASRREASVHHAALTSLIGGLGQQLAQIDARLANLERGRWTHERLITPSLIAIWRAAMLGV